METALQEYWFVLDSCPAILYRAARFGADWNGWATPVITAPTLATLLLEVISDPNGSYLAFAIDEAGRCTLQDHDGRIDILTPDTDGLYDLGGLGWTFRNRNDLEPHPLRDRSLDRRNHAAQQQ
jgi:hypothetical protein